MSAVWKRNALLSVFLTIVLLVGAFAQTVDNMASVGAHRLQVRLEGSGTPAVVIDTGLGDGMDRWGPLQEAIARTTRVFAYNRAGYGNSEPGPLPRDCGREAEELRAALENASVPGPYVLVGHSLGALNVQIFAQRYPQSIAGIILLDPPPLSFIRGEEYTSLLELAEKMTREWEAIARTGADSVDPGERKKASFFEMIASEHRELFGASAELVSQISSFGDLPLLVMASGRANPAFGEIAEEYQRYWIEQSRALAEKSSRGKFIFAGESSHHLQRDVPGLVKESIESLVLQARGPSSLPH